jgi:hypothetical protein
MAKTLKQMLELYTPKAEDEKKFVEKHITVKTDDVNKNGDDVFQGKNVKTIERKKERHGYNAGEDEKVYEEVDQVDEKLGADATAGDYIKDFKKSDAPQFKGKSQEKRRTMGIAAYLQAKESVNESVEINEDVQVEELTEDVDVTLLELYAQLDEHNQKIMVQMIDEGRAEELYQFIEAIEE